MSQAICDECSLLFKKNALPVSLFRHMSLEQAESFSCTQAILELSTKAPTLFKIIHNSVVTRGLVRNKHKRGDVQYTGLCPAIGILLKEHKGKMCGVQSYISSALFNSQVYVCERSTQITVHIYFLDTAKSHQCYSFLQSHSQSSE